ncbi:hypothetical protein BJV82DRAFT_675255 [Fennellomyces sp. T-0311]|nr:hypothetical protein BJV82DRAFT_675255 [Fennellomyces sp. T-0311]
MQSKLDGIEAVTNPEQWPLVRQVYLDLVLAKKWKTVETVPVATLQTTLIIAQQPNTSADQHLVIFPILQDTALSTARISDLFQTLAAADLTNDGKELR